MELPTIETTGNQGLSLNEVIGRRRHAKLVLPRKQSVMTRGRVGGVKPKSWSARIPREPKRTKSSHSKMVCVHLVWFRTALQLILTATKIAQPRPLVPA